MAKFISSPDQFSEWDSVKTAPDSISRADIVSDSTQSRRARYRTTTEKASTSPSPSNDAANAAEVKTGAKVPAYRVRGRNRGKQDTENDKNLTESTTAKSIGESSQRTARRKSYQPNKPRTTTRNENQSNETNNKDAVSSTHHATQTFSSRKNHASNSDTESKPSTDLPANHQPENHRKTYGDGASTTTRKSPTGRRYRIRVVEANSINANSQTSDGEKKASSLANTTDDPKSKTKKPERDSANEEPNYPEHFKALLKSKKATVAPNPSSRINNFLPKKQIASTTTVEPTSSTQRPAYKHKKIERPNLKLLFPSLHASSSTTESTLTSASTASTAGAAATATDGTQTATDDIDTETIAPNDVTSTTAKIKTTIHKQVGGIKFSSKIRTENEEPPAFRSRSTPLIFDTLRSSTQRLPTKTDTSPTNHRFSSVSSGFSNDIHTFSLCQYFLVHIQLFVL